MMLFITVALLLGIISMVSGAALGPVLQANRAVQAPSGDCGPVSIMTVYVSTTIYLPPETVTLAMENYTSVSESLSSAAAVDTAQVSADSEFAPISEAAPTSPFTFVHTIVVPIVEATAASNSSSGVFYVSIGQNTTDWSYTPTQSTVVGTTTVTVSPVPTARSTLGNSTITILSSTRLTRTTSRPGSAFPLSTGSLYNGSAPYPFTNGTSNSTRYGGASCSGGPSGTCRPAVSYNATVTIYSTVATTTVDVITYVTANVSATPTTNSTSTGIESALGYSGTNATFENSYDKRQVCTLVFATISGNLASWCNNWDGHTVFHYSSYSSTLTPSQYATEASSSLVASPTTNEASVSSADTSPSLSSSTTSAGSSGVSTTVPPTQSSSTFSAPAASSSCGQVGVFEINFDGLPDYSPPNNNTADCPPIFNPYEHFFWGNGWCYGPPPTEPFPPVSGDHVAQFVPSEANNVTNSPGAGTVPDNAFGAGPRAPNNSYWFDAESAYVGCDNGASDPSVIGDFVATAYQWDPINFQEIVVATEHFPQPPCPDFQDCSMKQIFFDSRFTQLSSLSFYCNVQGQLKIFWMDTIELSWWNNTCAAGLARAESE